MAYTFPTEAEITSYALAHFQTAFADPVTGKTPPLGPFAFLGQSARAVAGCILSVLEAQEATYNDAAPSSYIDDSGAVATTASTAALDRWAFVFGLPSNRGAGLYGRNAAQIATGGGATATGTSGLVLGSGTLTDSSGAIRFTLRSGVTLTGGSAAITIDATTAGTSGNLAAGQVLRWQSPPSGLNPTVTLSTALTGGLDEESDAELAARLLRFMQASPSSGTLADWRRWTEAAQDSNGALIGVKRAYCYKHKGGIGSVTITPVLSGSGSARRPSVAQATAIQTWLEGLAIATDTVIIERPWFPSASGLGIVIKARMLPAYQQDWSDVAATGVVVSGTAAAVVLKISPLPAALQTAIDNGKKPRIQVPFAGSATPFVARVTAYSPSGGDYNLTLDTALPVTAAGGEVVYAGGPAVLPVCAAVQSYIDSIGPSRASGYVAASDDWEDVVTISRIAQTAIDARDSGSPMVMYSPRAGEGVGVTISINGAAATAVDVPLLDTGSGPQLPELQSIIVRGV